MCIRDRRCVGNFGKLLGNVVASRDGRMGHHSDFLIRRVHFLCGDGVKAVSYTHLLTAAGTEAAFARIGIRKRLYDEVLCMDIVLSLIHISCCGSDASAHVLRFGADGVEVL